MSESNLKCGSSLRSAAYLFAATIALAGAIGCDSGCAKPPPPSSTGPSEKKAAARESFAARLAAEIPAQESPWVIAHALLAFGPDLHIGEAAALNRLSARWVQRSDGRTFVALLGAGTLGEQHPHLVLKTLLHVFPTSHATAAELVRDLAKTAIAEFEPPTTFEQRNDVAWFLEAVARMSLPADRPIRPGGPTPRELAEVALATLESGDRLVENALEQSEFSRPGGSGGPETHGVFAYTCGGQHLLQGILSAAEHGFLDDAQRARLTKRLGVYRRRLDAEYRFRQREYDRAIASGASEILAEQMFGMFSLKLLGHGLEILGRAHRVGVGDPSQIEQAVRSTRGKLLGIFRRLDDDLDPDRTLLKSLRRSRPAMWQLWFGDGCHALRGLSETDDIGR